MCYFGFYKLLIDWWEGDEINITAMNSRKLNLLVIAQSVPICRLLVKKGIQVNQPLGGVGSALAAAVAYRRNMEIVKFLVQEAGAEVNMQIQCGNYGSALAAAAERGDMEIVKFLVQEAGAEVNMQLQGGSYSSALAAAGRFDNVQVVDFLIETGTRD
jgi:ankyrin repeat domain-containing protein 50